MSNVWFNVLAKNLENAKEISFLDKERILVGLMAKKFDRIQDAIELGLAYKKENIRVSVGLGDGDHSQCKNVIKISKKVKPFHINQVFPLSGYTLGVMEDLNEKPYIVNALIEPSNNIEKVYITTGPFSSKHKEAIYCETAIALLIDSGVNSIKFYNIKGKEKIANLKFLASLAAKFNIEIFEPTGGIDLHNVQEIVSVCLNAGVRTVIPHLYSSLIDEKTGKTKPRYIEKLLNMEF